MDSVSFPKGYLLSSTPVQSSEDSGYFGSGHRRSNVNVVGSCSPVKESSLKNVSEFYLFQREFCKSPQLEFDKNFHINSTKKTSVFGLEVWNELSELEFTSSNVNNQTDLYKTYSSITKIDQNILDIHYDSNNTRLLFNSLSEDKDIKYKLFEYESSDSISSTDDFEYSKNLNESFSLRGKCVTCPAFKQTKTDFIHELKVRNCFTVVSEILQHLSAKELSIASCVSKTWNKVILDDSKANLRRQNFITERVLFLNGPSKENRLGMRCGPANEHKTVFSDLANINTAVHLPTNSKVSNTKFDSFIKEAKNGQKLLKCPRCCYASKYLDGNNCMCTHCSYRFCRHCLDPILKNHTCFKPQLPNIVVGSRRSKKNLRRL